MKPSEYQNLKATNSAYDHVEECCESVFAAICLIVALFWEISVCELVNSQQQGNLVFVKSYQ